MNVDVIVNNILMGESTEEQIQFLIDEGFRDRLRSGLSAVGKFAKNKGWKHRLAKVALTGAAAYGLKKAYERVIHQPSNIDVAEKFLVRGLKKVFETVGTATLRGAQNIVETFLSQQGFSIVGKTLSALAGEAWQELREMSHEPTEREIRRIVHKVVTKHVPGGTQGLSKLRSMAKNNRIGARLERMHREFISTRNSLSRVGKSGKKMDPLSLYMLQFQNPITGGLLDGISRGALLTLWTHDMKLSMD